MRKLLIVLITSLLLIGCNDISEKEASEILTTYYGNFSENRISDNYNLLSTYNKKQLTKEEFLDWTNINDIRYKTLGFELEKVNTEVEFEIEYENYSDIVEIDIIVSIFDHNSQNEKTYNTIKYVINENNELRVLDKRNLRDIYSDSLSSLGALYTYDEGLGFDLEKAQYYLNKSLLINPDSLVAYYNLGNVYELMNEYEMAISIYYDGISKFKEDTPNYEKSMFYNVLGIIYEKTKEYDNAMESYNLALQLDSKNIYAEENLILLKEMLEIE